MFPSNFCSHSAYTSPVSGDIEVEESLSADFRKSDKTAGDTPDRASGLSFQCWLPINLLSSSRLNNLKNACMDNILPQSEYGHCRRELISRTAGWTVRSVFPIFHIISLRLRGPMLPGVPAVILFCSLLCLACTEHQTGASTADGRDRYAEYVAGISLLTTVKNRFTRSERLGKFRQLEEITGLGLDSVLPYLASLRDAPEKGKDLSLRMNRLYETKNDTALTNPTKE